MGDEVNEDEEGLFDEPSSRKISYGEFFKEWFPFYLNCGMTYDQYWNQSSELVIPYAKAYMMRRDEENYFAWLSGAYIYAGHSAALSNFGAGLSGKQGHAEYPKEPFEIRPKTEEEIEAEMIEKRKKFVASLNRFHAMMEAKKNAGQ